MPPVLGPPATMGHLAIASVAAALSVSPIANIMASAARDAPSRDDPNDDGILRTTEDELRFIRENTRSDRVLFW